MDHAGAFGHAGEGVSGGRVGWESESGGQQFGKGVGCHYGFGSGEPGVVCGGEGGVSGWNAIKDFRNGKSLADDPCGHNERGGCAGFEALRCCERHGAGIFEASVTSDCICTARVDDDAIDPTSTGLLEDGT